MRNIKMVIMYDGSGYAGWQRLGDSTGKRSIQSVIEDCLLNYFKESIKISASGRTDAGVHAFGQVANFNCSSKESVQDIKMNLNKLLPDDIVILTAQDVDKQFHSRYSAKLKTYEYRIDQGKTQSVFSRKFMLHVPEELNLVAMQTAANYLIGTHDFKAFSTDRKDGKSTVRTIESIKISRLIHNKITDYDNCLHDENVMDLNHYFYSKPMSANEVRITITGDGFLYNMIRIIVGTLIEVGQNKKRPEDIYNILKSRERQMAGMTIYPQGLYLCHVKY